MTAFPSVVPLLADKADITLPGAIRGHQAFRIHTDARLASRIYPAYNGTDVALCTVAHCQITLMRSCICCRTSTPCGLRPCGRSSLVQHGSPRQPARSNAHSTPRPSAPHQSPPHHPPLSFTPSTPAPTSPTPSTATSSSSSPSRARAASSASSRPTSSPPSSSRATPSRRLRA